MTTFYTLTEIFRVAKKISLYDKADKGIRKWASTISAILVLIGAATGICSWVSSRFQDAVAVQITDFQKETRDSNLRHEQAVSRLELMMLMEHDPENTVAIEQLARYYFNTLGGDKYMTGKYSAWAKKYGGDTSLVIGGV